MTGMKRYEALAEWLAEKFVGVELRQEDEPVYVARIHRDLAEGIIDHLAATDRGAVEALREIAATVEMSSVKQHAADRCQEIAERALKRG